jgi:helicase
MHTLALIASGVAKNRSDLEAFFSRTFFAHQYGDLQEVMSRVEKILKELESYKFIKIGNEPFISQEFTPAFELATDSTLEATRTGKRVSELYLDPQSGDFIIQNFQEQKDIEYLLAINQCIEMKPLLRVKGKEYNGVQEDAASSGIKAPDMWDIDYDEFLATFKTSLMFNDWMSELGENALLEKYGIAPGELYTKTSNAQWLFYAASELAKLLNKHEIANQMNRLRLRIKYGVKEELLPLISLKNIGRVRARLLFKNGIKSYSDIKTAPIERLEKIVGKNVAKHLKERSDEDITEKMRRFKGRRA